MLHESVTNKCEIDGQPEIAVWPTNWK